VMNSSQKVALFTQSSSEVVCGMWTISGCWDCWVVELSLTVLGIKSVPSYFIWPHIDGLVVGQNFISS
jgi:hypothetical protein